MRRFLPFLKEEVSAPNQYEEEEAFYGPFLSQEEAMEAMAKENIPASR